MLNNVTKVSNFQAPRQASALELSKRAEFVDYLSKGAGLVDVAVAFLHEQLGDYVIPKPAEGAVDRNWPKIYGLSLISYDTGSYAETLNLINEEIAHIERLFATCSLEEFNKIQSIALQERRASVTSAARSAKAVLDGLRMAYDQLLARMASYGITWTQPDRRVIRSNAVLRNVEVSDGASQACMSTYNAPGKVVVTQYDYVSYTVPVDAEPLTDLTVGILVTLADQLHSRVYKANAEWDYTKQILSEVENTTSDYYLSFRLRELQGLQRNVIHQMQQARMAETKANQARYELVDVLSCVAPDLNDRHPNLPPTPWAGSWSPVHMAEKAKQADYKELELRTVANFAIQGAVQVPEAEKLLKDFNAKHPKITEYQAAHARFQEAIANINAAKTPEERAKAKRDNFLALYGGGNSALNIESVKEAVAVAPEKVLEEIRRVGRVIQIKGKPYFQPQDGSKPIRLKKDGSLWPVRTAPKAKSKAASKPAKSRQAASKSAKVVKGTKEIRRKRDGSPWGVRKPAKK